MAGLDDTHSTVCTACILAVSAHLSGLHSAIKMLVQRVRLVQEVVSKMRSGGVRVAGHTVR